MSKPTYQKFAERISMFSEEEHGKLQAEWPKLTRYVDDNYKYALTVSAVQSEARLSGKPLRSSQLPTPPEWKFSEVQTPGDKLIKRMEGATLEDIKTLKSKWSELDALAKSHVQKPPPPPRSFRRARSPGSRSPDSRSSAVPADTLAETMALVAMIFKCRNIDDPIETCSPWQPDFNGVFFSQRGNTCENFIRAVYFTDTQATQIQFLHIRKLCSASAVCKEMRIEGICTILRGNYDALCAVRYYGDPVRAGGAEPLVSFAFVPFVKSGGIMMLPKPEPMRTYFGVGYSDYVQRYITFFYKMCQTLPMAREITVPPFTRKSSSPLKFGDSASEAIASGRKDVLALGV